MLQNRLSLHHQLCSLTEGDAIKIESFEHLLNEILNRYRTQLTSILEKAADQDTQKVLAQLCHDCDRNTRCWSNEKCDEYRDIEKHGWAYECKVAIFEAVTKLLNSEIMVDQSINPGLKTKFVEQVVRTVTDSNKAYKKILKVLGLPTKRPKQFVKVKHKEPRFSSIEGAAMPLARTEGRPKMEEIPPSKPKIVGGIVNRIGQTVLIRCKDNNGKKHYAVKKCDECNGIMRYDEHGEAFCEQCGLSNLEPTFGYVDSHDYSGKNLTDLPNDTATNLKQLKKWRTASEYKGRGIKQNKEDLVIRTRSKHDEKLAKMKRCCWEMGYTMEELSASTEKQHKFIKRYNERYGKLSGQNVRDRCKAYLRSRKYKNY